MVLVTVELMDWAERQPLAFELVNGRLARLSEEHQGPARLLAMQRITEGVFGCADRASTWMATPSPMLGGLSPSNLACESDEGSQLALRALVRWHRSTLSQANA